MIKVGSFEFEGFESKNYWADFAVFGSVDYSAINFYDKWSDVTIHLDAEDTWQMAMDQSTTNTGIFIKNYKNTKAYMI